MSKTKWLPHLAEGGPRYRALADAIASDIKSGALRPGAKLPPVRDLAWDLKVTPGTVSRAYQLAETRGLLEGHVGRGTFVVENNDPPGLTETFFSPPVNAIDLRLNLAPNIGQDATLSAALERLLVRHDTLPLTAYHRYGAQDQTQREAASEWLASGGLPARPGDTLLCAGAQQALLTALLATTGGTDALAVTESLLHPGLKDCARTVGIRLEPVEMDEDGLIPDALDAACARFRPSALILSANDQNPTLIRMSVARREAIAAIARARDIQIIEDDVYGWLIDTRPPSFPTLAPERSWYLASLSKCVAAGLRSGFLLTPPGEGGKAARILQATTQHLSWLVASLTAELLTSGDAAAILEEVRTETRERARLTAAVLEPVLSDLGGAIAWRETSSMAWITLPEPWRASDFVAACDGAGVLLKPAEVFAVGRASAPHAVRIGFGIVQDREMLEQGLGLVRQTLKTGPVAIDTVA